MCKYTCMWVYMGMTRRINPVGLSMRTAMERQKNICIFSKSLYTEIKSHNFFTKCIFIRYILC